MSGSPLASFSGLHRRVPFFFEGHTKIIAGKGGGGGGGCSRLKLSILLSELFLEILETHLILVRLVEKGQLQFAAL